MKSYNAILRAVMATPWAIQPEKLEAILAFLELKVSGGSAAPEMVAAIRAENKVAAARAQNIASSSKGSVAVLPLYGLIMHRASMMGDISGPQGTSTDQFTQQLRQAVSDPGVQAIVIDVDSPGGSVEGVEELAQEIYNARKQKKITAVSNCLCASAAYYLAAQASELVASPSSLTGSVGVYCTHADMSKADEMSGAKFTMISYGAHKTEGNEYEPLSDDARAHMQDMVDTYGLMFEKAVARGRGVALADVQKKFGQGRVFPAQQAVKLGMADRVGTLDDVLGKHGVSRGGTAARASVNVPAIVAAAPPDPDNDDLTAAGDDDLDCLCACEACVNGDCSACAHEECACNGCACDMAAAAAEKKKNHAVMRRQIQLAGA